MKKSIITKLLYLLCCCLAAQLLLSATTMAKPKWCTTEPEPEVPSAQYDSILYSEIAPRLCEIQKNSDRVNVEVIGESAGGRNLFLATVTGRIEKKKKRIKDKRRHKKLRKFMINNPEKALTMIEDFDDFNVPVFINCSIHGDEYPGTDACMQMIEYLAYDNSAEVQAILDNTIVLFNVVQNPDGRVLGTRRNANNMDINRDMITQSQSETRATVSVVTDWNPMVFLDLHGFVNPMLIEPCTPPHNPNYEYDLYLTWAWELALAMEDELMAQTAETAIIPYRDWDLGWDDWAPIYAAMYPIFHGAYGHTIETPQRDSRGVEAHWAVVWGALNYVVNHKIDMVRDQIEVFRRGFLDLPQQLIPDSLLAQTPWDQYNDMTVQEFPAAYVIPVGPPFQLSKHQAARLVDFLLYNGVQVEAAKKKFTLNGTEYPKGTYVVWMDQAKRGMANTILDAGHDLSDITGLVFYSPPSVWSHPYLWGAFRDVMVDPIDIKTKTIQKAKAVKGSVKAGKASAHCFLPTSLEAFQAANYLLDLGVTLYRTKSPFDNSGETVGSGAFLMQAPKWMVKKVAKKFALKLFPVKDMPGELTPLEVRKIAIYGDGSLMNCLDRLGFSYEQLTVDEINAGQINGYDLFINQNLGWNFLNPAGQEYLAAWFAAGGDYIGLSYQGDAIQLAIEAGIADVAYSYVSGNAIVNIDYDPTDSVSAGFREDGYAFVYEPGFFNSLGLDVEVSARFDAGTDFLLSGFWPGWQTSGANGMPVIVHQSTGARDVSLIGIDAIFRGHPENSFRIVGNAIYDGL